MNTVKELFGDDATRGLDKGILYYPASGEDTKSPLLFFMDCVNKFHFSDIRSLNLPYPECGIKSQYRCDLNERKLELRKRVGIIGKDIILEAEEGREQLKEYMNENMNKTIKNYFRFNFGTLRSNLDNTKCEKWTVKLEQEKYIKIYTHKADSVKTLMGLDKIAVFFYRLDSPGEGGSDQYWFSPDLFNLLLYKLMDGALIVTDGSNFHPHIKDVPWRGFCEESKKNFKYNGVEFKYIGRLPYDEISDRTHVWKIYK